MLMLKEGKYAIKTPYPLHITNTNNIAYSSFINDCNYIRITDSLTVINTDESWSILAPLSFTDGNRWIGKIYTILRMQPLTKTRVIAQYLKLLQFLKFEGKE